LWQHNSWASSRNNKTRSSNSPFFRLSVDSLDSIHLHLVPRSPSSRDQIVIRERHSSSSLLQFSRNMSGIKRRANISLIFLFKSAFDCLREVAPRSSTTKLDSAERVLHISEKLIVVSVSQVHRCFSLGSAPRLAICFTSPSCLVSHSSGPEKFASTREHWREKTIN
jgi:hypothetical protein